MMSPVSQANWKMRGRRANEQQPDAVYKVMKPMIDVNQVRYGLF
uniref:Senescence-associated family protein n=1 Tax=Rhizophora mucronata TaxID=61149 RepID=A0A2P2JBH3_RHIMU